MKFSCSNRVSKQSVWVIEHCQSASTQIPDCYMDWRPIVSLKKKKLIQLNRKFSFRFSLSKVLRTIVQRCLQKGEELRMTSIAFPVIGTGNLKFPPNAASRIMLEEVFSFSQANASSSLKDIRFVVYQQDQDLIRAFGQEIANFRSKHNYRQGYTVSNLLREYSIPTWNKHTSKLTKCLFLSEFQWMHRSQY